MRLLRCWISSDSGLRSPTHPLKTVSSLSHVTRLVPSSHNARLSPSVVVMLNSAAPCFSTEENSPRVSSRSGCEQQSTRGSFTLRYDHERCSCNSQPEAQSESHFQSPNNYTRTIEKTQQQHWPFKWDQECL